VATRRLPNVHPGEVLFEEFLKPMGISAYKLAKETKLSQTRISEILRKKRSVTADSALRFSKFFGNSAEFWLGLQNDYDLEENRNTLQKELESIRSMVALSKVLVETSSRGVSRAHKNTKRSNQRIRSGD